MQKRYWLRGGMVGVILSVLGLLIISLMPVMCIGLSVDGTGCIPPTGVDAFIYNIKFISEYFMPIVSYYIIPLVLFCSLVGFIYGKLKNRNRV